MTTRNARRGRGRGRGRLRTVRHSNGTFWHRGTRRLGHPAYLIGWDWWALAAGWQRAVLRVSAVAVVLVVGAVVVS